MSPIILLVADSGLDTMREKGAMRDERQTLHRPSQSCELSGGHQHKLALIHTTRLFAENITQRIKSDDKCITDIMIMISLTFVHLFLYPISYSSRLARLTHRQLTLYSRAEWDTDLGQKGRVNREANNTLTDYMVKQAQGCLSMCR